MKIPGTSIEVDDFRTTDATLHVLTHYHADHRKGLRVADPRPILCSTITARLLADRHAIAPTSIRTIDPGETLPLDGRVLVQAFDANHCPGALMLLFTVDGVRHLHTGDFRYCPAHDACDDLFRDIDTLFLDECYGHADGRRWDHPPQEEAIAEVVRLVRDHPGRVLLAVYTIGKNRVVEAIHRELGLPVWLPPHYHRVYELIGMGHCVTRDAATTRVHGQPMAWFRGGRLRRGDLAIIPTGWMEGRGSGPNVRYVPYSEHNGTGELQAFVAKVNARRVVRTNDFF